MEIIDLEDGLDVEVGDVVFNYQLKEEEIEELATEKFKSHQKKKKQKKEAPASSAPSPSSPPPFRTGASPLPASTDTTTRDFGIFIASALVALFAFYFGLNSSYRASFPKEERHGKSLWSDKIMSSSEE